MTDPRISVIVGVTGHRDLKEQDKEALQAADFDFSDMNGAVTSAEIHAHYDELPESEQGKDWKPMESMLKLVKKYDGLRIYRLGWTPVKDKK